MKRGIRDPEEWILFRRENPDVPLAALIADIQQQAIEAYRWQPIETAPRDGTEILGWCSRLGRHIVSWGCQPQHNPHSFWVSSTCKVSHIDQPTHWMELPDAPN